MTAEHSSAFFVTGGTLRPDAACYVERQADHDLLEALLKGEFCYVLTSRQMGKSSLMVHAAVKLRERGVHVVVLDLSAIGQNVNAEQWYNGLLAGIGRQLHLDNELEEFWNTQTRLTPMQRLVAALREVVLVQRQGSLVLFVDELDVVRSLPFKTDEFFATIRSCFNQRAEDTEFQRLTFCLLGVATPSDLIQDPRITPFNIGRRIELHDFTGREAAPLARGLEAVAGHPGAAVAALQRILHWTNGHPYLTQRLCQAVALRNGKHGSSGTFGHVNSTVDELCAELFLTERARERDDNLVFVRDRILRLEVDRAALLHLYEQVLGRAGAPDDETNPLVGILGLAGIVRREADKLRVRNRIYARAFDRRWVEANMPDAEKRRQREAYRRGVLRASMVATAVLFVMATLAGLALRSRSLAREATWTALRDQARLSRLSARPGQRFGALDSLQRASRIKASPELRDEAIACLALPDLRRGPGILLPDTNVAALAFSKDLKSYAFATVAGEIVLRKLDGERDLARWRTDGAPPTRIWFAPDPQYLLLAHSTPGGLKLSYWHCFPPERLFSLTNRMQVDALDMSPDSRYLAMGGEDGMVRTFTLPEGNLHAEWEMEQACSSAAYDPKGHRLAVASSESLTIRLYAAASGKLMGALHSASPPSHLAWYPDGRLLAAAGADRRVRLWEVAADETDEFPKQELPPHPGELTSLAFNQSGTLLASACADGALRLWEPGQARLLLTAPVSGSIPQLGFSPDDQQLGFSLSGRQLSLWQVAAGEECRTLFDYEAEDLSAVDIHPDGGLLATAHRDGVTLWDLTHGSFLARMTVGGTSAVRFQPGSGDLVTAEFRGVYRFQVARERQAQAGQLMLRLKPKEDFYLGPIPSALDFARDADVLAVAYEDRIRLVRNTNSAYAILGELVGQPGFGSVSVSADGRLVAAGNWKSGEIWVWDRGHDTTVRRWQVGGRAQVRFSPDGQWLATGTERTAALRDTRTLQPVVQLERPPSAAHPAALAFAPDGRTWAVAWTDTRVRLLELNGRVVADLEPPHNQSLVGLAFSPDGLRLVCATTARTVLVWNLGEVAHRLAELQLDHGPKLPAASGAQWETTPRIGLEIGALDRLRLSQAGKALSIRREIGDLTDLIRREPGRWNYLRYRAEKYRFLGEYDKAIADYLEWIRLEQASIQSNSSADRAWPLRDLAMIYLAGPEEVRDYEKGRSLTQEALQLEPENADNQFRHGLACYRLNRYEEAETSFDAAWRTLVSKKKTAAVVLFYQAMCQARQRKHQLATQSLAQARQDYARTDLKYRESHVEELAELVWEAERVVSESEPGG